MTIAPITKKLVMQLAVQSALPLVPLILLGTPTAATENGRIEEPLASDT